MAESVQTQSGRATSMRVAVAVLVGAILWMAGFLALASVLAALWPAYGSAARMWVQSADNTFTTTMLVYNESFWILAEVAAGWLATVIGRRAGAVWILAAIVMGYLCIEHFYYAWHELPRWYNLIVAISSGPAVLLGGKLCRGSARTESPAGHAAA